MWVLLDAEGVVALHGRVLNPSELPGPARDRSLEAALARVENRVAYGMIGDVHGLAAACTVALAEGARRVLAGDDFARTDVVVPVSSGSGTELSRSPAR